MLPSIFGESLFDDLWNANFSNGFLPAERDFGKPKPLMKTDVHESETGYEMTIELPGYDKENISVELKEGYLTVTARKTSQKKEEGKRLIRQERFMGSCSRSFYIGDVKAESVKGKYEAGVLTLSFPKAELQEPEQKKAIAID